MKTYHGSAWVIVFLTLGLMSLLLLRPQPVFKPRSYSRSITDARGVTVSIPENARVAAYSWEFLTETHRPDRLSGRSERIRNMLRGYRYFMPVRVYRAVFDNDAYWHDTSTLETLLASSNNTVIAGATWFHNHAIGADELRALGVIALDVDGTNSVTADEKIARETTIYNEIINQPAFAQTLIARYQQDYSSFHADYKAPTNPIDCPRIAGVGAPDNDWSKVSMGGGDTPAEAGQKCDENGTRDAVAGFRARGRQQDAERVLAVDPDIIMLMGTDARKFMQDPRWQGLKAVHSRRVYTSEPAFSGYSYNIDNRPFAARWSAEVIHPELIKPRVRQLLRDHYQAAYGYHLSQEELDGLLSVKQNSQSAGYERFFAAKGESIK